MDELINTALVWIDYSEFDNWFTVQAIKIPEDKATQGTAGMWAVCVFQQKYGGKVGIIKYCNGQQHANEVADAIRRVLHCSPYEV